LITFLALDQYFSADIDHQPTKHRNQRDAGIVSTHAQTIRPATFQRTDLNRRSEPTPTMAPVIVMSVETGMPKWAALKSVIAPAASAAKPPIGCRRVISIPWCERYASARQSAETNGSVGE